MPPRLIRWYSDPLPFMAMIAAGGALAEFQAGDVSVGFSGQLGEFPRWADSLWGDTLDSRLGGRAGRRIRWNLPPEEERAGRVRILVIATGCRPGERRDGPEQHHGAGRPSAGRAGGKSDWCPQIQNAFPAGADPDHAGQVRAAPPAGNRG